MEIPIGFESFEIPNKDFFAIEDLGSNKELALISVPEEFDVAELKGISFIADGAIPLKCSSDSACTQKWEIHGFPAPPKQQTNVLFLSKHGEHKFGPPISVYLNITQDFNIPYQKPLKKTKKKHLEIPENLRVRWKPFGSDEPYRKQISANSSSKDFTRSNVLKQNTSNIEINRNDDVIKKLETSFVVNEEIRTPNKKRHNVENYYDKKNLSGAIDELEIFNAKHSKKKKPNSKNTLNSNEEISNASRKNKTNSNNKLETNCTLNKDKTDKEKRKQSNANDIKSVTDSDIRKSKTTIHDCEEENGREYENDYVGVKKKKKKTTRKDNESNENEKDENVNFSEENIKKMAKNNLSSDYKMKENKEVMDLSLNDVNVKKTKTFSTDHIANEVEKTKRQVFDEDGKVNKKVKKMKKKPKKDNEANDDSKESFNDLNEAKEKKKKKKKKKLSDDNDGQMNNNMISGADNKMGKIEKNYFSESKKVDERKKKKKIVNENEVNKCEDLSEFAQVDRKMKKEKKKKITDAQDNEISKDKSELIEYNEVQERKKKKKKKKTLSASDDEMNKEETSAYSESNKTGEKKKKKKTYSVNENGISNYEEKCASSEIDKVDERKKRKRLKPNDNEISDKKVKKESSDDDVNERKKKKKN